MLLVHNVKLSWWLLVLRGNGFSRALIEIDFEFQIFNRWGELIYATTDQYFRWDGLYKKMIVPDNVVVYKARIVDREETVHEYTGHITILR